jgi:purine-binding chemotaxis protein CheW
MTTADIAQANGEALSQLITFRSGDQEFGADIMMIREIRGVMPMTPLPHSPDYVCGVVNLRGVILPVVDLKAMLGRGQTDTTATNVTVVIRCQGRSMGLLVDAVSDILTVNASQIQPTPEMSAVDEHRIVEGIAVVDERMVTILDLEKLTISVAGRETQTAA